MNNVVADSGDGRYEALYFRHLSELASSLEADDLELDLWSKLSGLGIGRFHVCAIFDRTYGRLVQEKSIAGVVPPASLLRGGTCTIVKTFEPTEHEGLRRQVRASIASRNESNEITSFECSLNSVLTDGAWKSTYWTINVHGGKIIRRGAFPQVRSKGLEKDIEKE